MDENRTESTTSNRRARRYFPLAAVLGGLLGWAIWLLETLPSPGLSGAVSQWLRTLSLSGPTGDAAAWALVLALSALPALGLLWRGRCRADWLLVLAALELFAGLYFLVNPSLVFSADLATLAPSLVRGWTLVAGGAVGSTLVAWALLRLLDGLGTGAQRWVPRLLFLAGLFYAMLSGASQVLDLLRGIAQVAEGNTDAGRVWASAVSLALVAALELIPQVLGAWVLLWGGDLCAAMERAPFSGETLDLAEALRRRCRTVARLSLILTVLSNALSMLSVPWSASVHVQLYLPVGTLALCAALVLLCRYFRRAKAVSDDNDSII